MRQIVLDTETTGLKTSQGHRIIEIGCVEISNRHITDKRYHQYLQPNRKIDAEARTVHGITDEFLQDKPRFAEIADEFIAFIKGAELIIHNVEFDVGFINYELRLLNRQTVTHYCQKMTDTLALARKLHPGKKNTLDALCKRYHVDNSNRQRHGALLDAEILALVYLAMTGGQVSLLVQGNPTESNKANIMKQLKPIPSQRAILARITPYEEELHAHEQCLIAIEKASGGKCLWRNFMS
ncbi:MAG: DNA polymerase III subunit epsilon [Candidatus Parabeggiatoa sp. nov. 3]|jgi:DNA polymerase-3 subunit epsilon|nr:MAG: DNA polymerase III subunit epsilon [Gammaproteobacteria bacterium]RKZ60011.1 MAG: DNA polymerase III subunit epsilon [Gammaproteobacteria bacterium]RKZ79329.1 MAG: DNA polymerase III subunit epsilon [Gammaproteobacteria bacterium]